MTLLVGAMLWRRSAHALADTKKLSASPAERAHITPPGPFAIPDDLPKNPRFVVIKLHDEVNLGMAAFVERVARELEKDDVLVLDIKTFGGRLDAAATIRDALLHTHDAGARAVVYINPRAISAGALISFAADVIVVSQGATMGAATPVRIDENQEMKPVGEKTVSYMRQEMRSTAEARGRNGDIAEAMVDSDMVVPGLSAKGKLLTLDGKRALKWGIASLEADNFDAVVKGLGYADANQYQVRHVERSWAEIFAGWISGSAITSLLMSIGMLAIMIGLYTGGNVIALSLGATCLGLFFFGHHVVNVAGVEDMVVFGIGLALIAVEVALPGHIYPGIVGLLLIVAALFMGLIDFSRIDFSVQLEVGYIQSALATVFGSILLTAMGGFGVAKLLPKSAYGRRLLLATVIDARVTDGLDVVENEHALAGANGMVVSALRPSGKVQIDGKRYDARSQHEFIDKGTAIRVVKRKAFELLVVPVEDQS